MALSLGEGALVDKRIWGVNFAVWWAAAFSLNARKGDYTFTSDNPEATEEDLASLNLRKKPMSQEASQARRLSSPASDAVLLFEGG